MVDTSGNDSIDTPAGTTAARRAPRKAAMRPAGPPEATTSEGTSAAKAPAKKAAAKKTAAKKAPAKKAAAKKTAADKAGADKTEAQAPASTAKKAAKSTTAKSASAKATTTKSSAAKKAAASKPADSGDAPKATKRAASKKAVADTTAAPLFQAPDASAPRRRSAAKAAAEEPAKADKPVEASGESGDEGASGSRRRRRRGSRGRRGTSDAPGGEESGGESSSTGPDEGPGAGDAGEEGSSSSRRRRRRRRRGQDAGPEADDPPQTVVRVREPRTSSPESAGLKGSVRLEAKRQRRREGRDAGRRRSPILTEAEFLARRESVDRVMVVRQSGERAQVAVLEDGILVEHYVDRGTSSSMVGNVYLGRVQNVLPSMEAAFVDIGRGRNAVLYAGEVNWDAAGLEGQPRRIEMALKSGDAVLVQVTKDPMGQKGARLTSQVSLPGRFLVYVPDGSMTGISRKLPDNERSRLKAILKRIVPEDAGVIVRTAAEGASEEELTHDISRLTAQWDEIVRRREGATPPTLLSSEPDLAIKVVRDIFNEDFAKLVVSGGPIGDEVRGYVGSVAPDLLERVETWAGPQDLFTAYRVEEQLTKALDRKVWLPSGGSLVIDRTEAMTVIDVNTGKFTGQGGNLEETVTKNNLEAAEEIVRQLRLRDIGGIIVVDFIDMVLESNRDLVLRRLVECLGRDRTKHQVAEVTSLGLVQMTRKRISQGLLESFSTTCEHCGGRGMHVSLHLEDDAAKAGVPRAGRRRGKGVDPADVMAGAVTRNGEEAEEAEAELVEAERVEAELVEAVDEVLDGEVVDGEVVEGATA